jgi:glycosyltransferase involved in cell wall biosynthesis
MIDSRGLTDRVQIIGFQFNPYSWMANAKILVLCSDYEGLPNVLIESLVCGTPVISTDCPSGPRQILGDALPSSLVPCGNSVELAARICSFLVHPPSIGNIDLSVYNYEHTVAAYENIASKIATTI